jgi:thiol-disulfide isomerase/thioredoxin
VALAGALALVGAGCNGDKATPPPKERTNVVSAKDGPTVASAKSAPSTEPAASAKPRQLCSGQSLRDGPHTIEQARATGKADKPGELRYGRKWVWVNVWAAWCEPCKKEMPMLRAWRDNFKKQGIELTLAFVSIDDDEREMMRFLEKQPEDGLRATYWLPEGEVRDKWFESVGYDDTPTLPIHAFVNPEGKLACVVEGALEETDAAPLKTFLSAGS